MDGGRDALDIGIVVMTPDFRVVGMNAFARNVLGPAMNEPGRSVFEYFTKKSHAKIRSLLKEVTADAPAAMVVDALDRVLCINVSRLRLEEPLTEFIYTLNFTDITGQTSAAVNPTSGVMELRKFPVAEREACLFLDASEVYFIRSEGNYCRIATTGKSYYLNLSLKKVLKRYAGANFLRVHRSYIVNLDRVAAIKQKQGGNAVVFDDKRLPHVPVSRRKYPALKKALPPS